MERSPWLLRIPIAVLLTGCAIVAPPDTPAQTLARQRIKECDRFPSVQIREVLPDGGIRVSSYGVSSVTEFPAWKACVTGALDRQRKDGRIAADTEPMIQESNQR